MESRRSSASETEPKLLRVSQAARLLNVSKDTIYRMVRADEIPHRMVHGMIRIPVAAVRRELGEDDD